MAHGGLRRHFQSRFNRDSGMAFHTILLALAAFLLPLIWGWLSHWAIERVWSRRHDSTDRETRDEDLERLVDYQI